MSIWDSKPILKCQACGRNFKSNRSDQKFCSRQCREAAFRFRHNPDAEIVPLAKFICDRTDCRQHKLTIANNCDGLIQVYEDTSKCPFYKTKEQYLHERKKR